MTAHDDCPAADEAEEIIVTALMEAITETPLNDRITILNRLTRFEQKRWLRWLNENGRRPCAALK